MMQIYRGSIISIGVLLVAGLVLSSCDTKPVERAHTDSDTMEHTATIDHEHEQEMLSGEDHGHDHGAEPDDKEVMHTDWEDIMDIETAVAEIRPLQVSIDIPGTIIPHPDHVALISPFIDARINEVFVTIGDRVETDELLVCLTSPDIGLLWAEYDRAVADLNIQEQTHERVLRLYDEDILPERTREEAERDLKVSQVNLDYAYQRLRAIGILEEEIELRTPCAHGGAASAIHLYAPIKGVITERNGAIGEKADPSNMLLQIVDLDPVWLNAEVFVKDIAHIQTGAPVEMQVSAYDSVFTGTIFNVGDTVAEKTKTVSIRAEFDNPGGRLKPGMFATAEVAIDTRPDALVVPREAVLEQGSAQFVFVLENGDYHRHEVNTGIEHDGWIEVISGLTHGAIVVTTGNFQLASQSVMNAADPHAGHNH